MAITDTGGLLVEAPKARPARYGLLSTVEVEEMTGSEWERGVSFDVDTCDAELGGWIACGPIGEEKSLNIGFDTIDVDPFAIYAGSGCSVPGRPLDEDWDRAERQLRNGEARMLERIFWTGLASGNAVRRTLNDPGVVDLTPAGGPLDLTSSLAVLESALGDTYAGEGYIHMSRGLATFTKERGLFDDCDCAGPKQLATGTNVVIGGGYPVNGPAGVDPDPGEAWLYATGAVKVWRGPVFFTPERGNRSGAFNKATNDSAVYAERMYAIGYDCGPLAIRTTYKSCCC